MAVILGVWGLRCLSPKLVPGTLSGKLVSKLLRRVRGLSALTPNSRDFAFFEAEKVLVQADLFFPTCFSHDVSFEFQKNQPRQAKTNAKHPNPMVPVEIQSTGFHPTSITIRSGFLGLTYMSWCDPIAYFLTNLGPNAANSEWWLAQPEISSPLAPIGYRNCTCMKAYWCGGGANLTADTTPSTFFHVIRAVTGSLRAKAVRSMIKNRQRNANHAKLRAPN